jgi:Domain of unknown function (DUF1972)
MKIGIIGTRGIPNQHGGFEQFAEFVAPALVSRGHRVFVYNSSLHPHQDSNWKGVELIKKADPEKRLGTIGHFIYDLNCILDTRYRKFDVILQLGYTSSSVWASLFPKGPVVVTNMDGLEWKRAKYSKPVRNFLKIAEKWAVLKSDKLIADSKGIQAYLLDKYGRNASFVAYGATLFEDPDERALDRYELLKYSYHLLIARMEPENNIETIIQGHLQSATEKKLLLIGNYNKAYGTYLKDKYEDHKTLFLGPVYDIDLLNNLRHFSSFYFHGHSVGGTNPSLLEAMASQALIIAHDNIFNKAVLGEDAFYFWSAEDIASILENKMGKPEFKIFLENNNSKIEKDYSWDHITTLLENCLLDAVQEREL